jgi:thiamine-phosphate pyrophosphorylase
VAQQPLTFPPLYAILDVDLVTARGFAPLAVCDAWLSAGIGVMQLRAKSLGTGAFVELADHCVLRARESHARVIINDRADIALMCGAGGVHVGQDDLAPEDVRRVVGIEALVGLSTHTDAQIAAALTAPISYIAIGPVFATQTKATGYQAVGLAKVRRAALAAHGAGLPLVAIGGITQSLAASVFDAGADAVAVISDLLPPAGGDLAARAAAWVSATTR